MLILRFSNLISLYKNQRKLSLKLEKSMILTDPILRSLFKIKKIDSDRKKIVPSTMSVAAKHLFSGSSKHVFMQKIVYGLL